MARAFRIGLTGGLASGKSTVAQWLAEAGFRVVDADRLVAELYRPGQPGAAAVRRLFGDQVMGPHGGVDHELLAERVFADDDARRALEEVVHPLVGDRFQAIAAAEDRPTVLEATLLVEAGFADRFDLLVTVEAEPEHRLQRALAKGMDPNSAAARLRAQGDGLGRRQAADLILWNNGNLEELYQQVEKLIEEIRTRAGARDE